MDGWCIILHLPYVALRIVIVFGSGAAEMIIVSLKPSTRIRQLQPLSYLGLDILSPSSYELHRYRSSSLQQRHSLIALSKLIITVRLELLT